MARHPWTPDCELRDCKRAAFKGGLCRKHWQSVPWSERIGVALDSMAAAHAAARKRHARIRRIAREIERAA